jgi:hypothetical protein
MIDVEKEKSGTIQNIFTESELDVTSNLMSKLPSNKNKSPSSDWFKPIGQGHQLYSWFNKKIFFKLKPLFNKDIHLDFGAFCDQKKPFGIHSDYYHKKIGLGDPCIAILLPLSLDNGDDSLSKSKTIIFNEQDKFADDSVVDTEKTYTNSVNLNRSSIRENNAEHLHDDLLGHCDKEDLKYLTVQNILEWNKGDVCWWGEPFLHCSNNWINQGVESKQYIVIHTYTKEGNNVW